VRGKEQYVVMCIEHTIFCAKWSWRLLCLKPDVIWSMVMPSANRRRRSGFLLEDKEIIPVNVGTHGEVCRK